MQIPEVTPALHRRITAWGIRKVHHSASFQVPASTNPFAVGCVVLAVLLTVGCGNEEQADGSNKFKYEKSADARWSIGVGGPRAGNTDLCLEDPAVAESWQSANLPSTSLNMVLVSGADEADAQRIADCLYAALPENEVTIGRPA